MQNHLLNKISKKSALLINSGNKQLFAFEVDAEGVRTNQGDKVVKLYVLVFSLLVISCSSIVGCAQIGGERNNGGGLAIDSFMYYYKRLNSIINANPFDTSKACTNSVRYMERKTNFKAHPDGNYLGWMPFTRKDLISWKAWYDKNKLK